MTEINLMTSDQRLIAVQKVVIASGDVNSVQLKVAFDSVWNRFTHKTAVFHTADDPTKYEALLIDNSCVVPWEVLQKPGTLFIGVVGVDELDNDIFTSDTKTSTLVKYKIEQGAERANVTLTPSMDLYQQYLKAFSDKVDPFRADVYAQMEAKIAEMEEMIRQHEEAIADITEGVVLWENPDPSAEFAGQTIELDTSEYKKIVVVYSGYETPCIERNVTYKTIYTTQSSDSSAPGSYLRTVLWNNNGIKFSDCAIGTKTYNGRSIPKKIIGYKSGGIKEAAADDGGFDI